MNKKLITLLLVSIILLGSFNMAFATNINNDKIDKLVKEGYITGYGNGDLGLNNKITRAEFATIITRTLEISEDTITSMKYVNSRFTDVNAMSWYNPYIAIASTQGIINGYPNGKFKPEKDVSYEEAITMLVRTVLKPHERMIVDASGQYPQNYIMKAYELGLLKDVVVVNTKLQADRYTVFTMLYNVLELKEQNKPIVEKPKYPVFFTITDRDNGTLIADVNITITNEKGNKINPNNDIYNLENGKYIFTVTKEGYKGIRGEFTVNNSSLNIKQSIRKLNNTSDIVVLPVIEIDNKLSVIEVSEIINISTLKQGLPVVDGTSVIVGKQEGFNFTVLPDTENIEDDMVVRIISETGFSFRDYRIVIKTRTRQAELVPTGREIVEGEKVYIEYKLIDDIGKEIPTHEIKEVKQKINGEWVKVSPNFIIDKELDTQIIEYLITANDGYTYTVTLYLETPEEPEEPETPEELEVIEEQ